VLLSDDVRDAAVFNYLSNFVEAVSDEDKSFMVFPYHLSKYKSVTDLPAGVTDVRLSLWKWMIGCANFCKLNHVRKVETSTPHCLLFGVFSLLSLLKVKLLVQRKQVWIVALSITI